MWILILLTVYGGSGSVQAEAVKTFDTPKLCHEAKAALYHGHADYAQVYLCLQPKDQPWAHDERLRVYSNTYLR